MHKAQVEMEFEQAIVYRNQLRVLRQEAKQAEENDPLKKLPDRCHDLDTMRPAALNQSQTALVSDVAGHRELVQITPDVVRAANRRSMLNLGGSARQPSPQKKFRRGTLETQKRRLSLEEATFKIDAGERPSAIAATSMAALTEEKSAMDRTRRATLLEIPNLVLCMEDARFIWGFAESYQTPPALQNLTLRVHPGELVMVTGPTGSGKSAFLLSVLGELNCITGHISAISDVAFSAQAPFIEAGTIKSNILCGRDFDSDWYWRVLDACSLLHDLRELPNGDETEIGERGVNLSGGQKARVSLARAIYSKAELYCLDDPLAAVDPHVARWIFERAIQGLLMNKAVILVTHDTALYKNADKLLVLEEGGKQVSFGVPSEENKTSDNHETPTKKKHHKMTSYDLGSPDTNIQMAKKVAQDRKSGKVPALIAPEETVVGKVELDTYLQYFKVAGWWLIGATWVLFFVRTGIMIYAEWFLMVWSEATPDDQKKEIWMQDYAGITAFVLLMAILNTIIYFFASLRASSSLHNKSLKTVLWANMSFFSSNPRGRILNKFSSDLGQIDEQLPVYAFHFLNSLFAAVSSLLLSVIAVPWTVLPMIPVVGVLVYIRQYFIPSSRALKRLESMTKSPIFTTFNCTLDGLVTIRSGAKQLEPPHPHHAIKRKRDKLVAMLFPKVHSPEENRESQIGPPTVLELMVDKFQTQLDDHARAWMAWLFVNRWVGFNLDMTCCVVLLIVVWGGIFGVVFGSANVGLVGFAITHAIQLSGVFQYGVRLSAYMETTMTSVERIFAYTNLKPDAPEKYKAVPPPPNTWPEKGKIEWKDASVRYREDLPTVLHGVNLTVEGHAKVGVVGRTGSGKTSMALALGRFNDIFGGSVFIDGIDVFDVPLKELRHRTGFVPQQPVCFDGTLRFNMDPEEKCTDEELMNIAEAAGMMGMIQRSSEGLDMQIRESGENLSAGEKQMVSLARAILHNASIYILDEATASIDYEADRCIQNTIRTHEAFKQSTVITVAHRIQTIIDSDLIVVLDKGVVVEMGKPQDLLADPESHFAKLAQRDPHVNGNVNGNAGHVPL